ncbi:MAG: hypothetical protein HYU66_24385 [Armatimonadetes bacterium]|nr:hypothetical protein [Armatimonadota bacterium]
MPPLIDRVSVPAYLSGAGAAVRAYALVGRSLALAWVQNPDHCLRSLAGGQAVQPVRDAQVIVPGVPAGVCRVEWWDTQSGLVTRTDELRAGNDGLTLELPELATDVALKIRW